MQHQCKLHIVILDFDWLKDNRKFSKPIILRKMMTKILCGNFENSFLEWEKVASGKVFRHFLHANIFMFILLMSNHTVFLVQFGINLHLWVFQKAHSCKLIPNWTRNRMITHKKLNDPAILKISTNLTKSNQLSQRKNKSFYISAGVPQGSSRLV